MKPPWQVWAFLFLALWSGYKAWELPSCPEPDDTGQQPPGVACVKVLLSSAPLLALPPALLQTNAHAY